MPLRLPGRQPLLAAAIAVAVPFASTAAANAACATTASSPVFSRLGDTANYSLLPGGNFETGAPGWSLGGASIVSGNESLFLGAKTDSRALSLPSTATAVSPVFCIGVEHPNFRFVARKASGSWGVIVVKVRYWNSSGKAVETTLGSVDGNNIGTTWTATPSIGLASSLPLWGVGQTVQAQLVFAPMAGGGVMQIDDIYVDPIRRY